MGLVKCIARETTFPQEIDEQGIHEKGIIKVKGKEYIWRIVTVDPITRRGVSRLYDDRYRKDIFIEELSEYQARGYLSNTSEETVA